MIAEKLPPLVVDLDGTLTWTDTLAESVLSVLRHRPWMVFQIMLWMLLGRARFKSLVAQQADVDIGLLPWRTDFIEWLQKERGRGRTLVLATAAHESIAKRVAQEWPIFDHVLATHGHHNLKGAHKLRAIQDLLGTTFSYAGDSRADLPIWRAATSAVVVGGSTSLLQRVRSLTEVEQHFPPRSTGVFLWLRALRAHQWVKNLLLFVPLFTAFDGLVWHQWTHASVAFLAFSLAASATYVLNDLWDLDSDRLHPRKRNRPFACGLLDPLSGLTMAAACLVLAMALAFWVSVGFAGILMGYVVLTTAYSLSLKAYVLMDVLMLAMLYTYRVIAGSVATAIPVTPWLFAFSVFTFFSLALVKRCAELVLLQQSGQTAARGRDYRTEDMVVLWPLGIAASLCAVVVFGLYIGSPESEARYTNTQWLWLIAPALLYWFSRLWIKTVRGEMHDDPIVFAVRDRGSRFCVACMVALVALAHWQF